MKKNIIPFFILLLTISFTSCLKDDKYALDPSGGHNVVEFYNVTAPLTGYNDSNVVYQPKTFLPVELDTFKVGINFAGPENKAPRDIMINLQLSSAVASKAGFTQLDPSLHSAIPSTVTIKKGEKTVFFDVVIKPGSFDFSKKNAIAIEIVSTNYAVVSGNVGKVVYSLPVKNKYDGVYEVVATSPMVDLTSSTLTGWYPLEANLITIDGNTNVMTSNTYLNGGYGHPIKSGTANSYYGNFSPIFKIDPVTLNVVEVTNHFGQGTNSSVRSGRLDPTGVNKFTFKPDGKHTLEVKYIMVQNGSDRTIFTEKWTYKSARP